MQDDPTIYIAAILAVVDLALAGAAVLVLWRLISGQRRHYDNACSAWSIDVACWLLVVVGISAAVCCWGSSRGRFGAALCWWCSSKWSGRGVPPGNIRCSGC